MSLKERIIEYVENMPEFVWKRIDPTSKSYVDVIKTFQSLINTDHFFEKWRLDLDLNRNRIRKIRHPLNFRTNDPYNMFIDRNRKYMSESEYLILKSKSK